MLLCISRYCAIFFLDNELDYTLRSYFSFKKEPFLFPMLPFLVFRRYILFLLSLPMHSIVSILCATANWRNWRFHPIYMKHFHLSLSFSFFFRDDLGNVCVASGILDWEENRSIFLVAHFSAVQKRKKMNWVSVTARISIFYVGVGKQDSFPA